MNGSNHDTGPASDGQLDDTCRRLAAEFAVNSGIAIQDGARTVPRLMSSAAPEIVGYGPHDFEDDPNLWLSIIHPEDVDRMKSAYDRLADGVALSEDYRIYSSDGQMKWIRELSAPRIDPAEGLLGVITLIKEVTGKKSVLSQIEEVAPLLEQIPSALVVRDVTGSVVWCNDACARLYGYESADQMVGTTFDDIIPPEWSEEFHKTIRPQLLKGRWSGEATLRRRDGSRIELSVSTNVIMEADGCPAAIIGALTDITERRRTERALRESEDLLWAVQNSMPALIAVLDSGGNIIAVNEPWERMARENGDPDLSSTGVGVNYLDVCRRAEGQYSEGAAEALQGLQRILDGTLQEFEIEYPCHSPSLERFFSMRAAPLRREAGGLVVAHIDTTDRVRAETALRESEEKHRTLVERANDGIVVLQDNLIRIVNPMFLRMSGYSEEEILNRPFVDFLTPEEQAFLYERYRRRMAGEHVPSIYETVMTRKDGSKIELEINAGIIQLEGKPADLVMFRDVSERKRAERALRESEEKLRTLVDSVDAVIFTVGPDLVPIVLAGHSERIGGYTIDELMASPEAWPGTVHPDDLPGLREEARKGADEHRTVSVEFRVSTKWNTIRWVRAHATPHYDEQGKLKWFSGVLTDVTDRALAQEREARYAARMAALAEISQAFGSTLEAGTILESASGRTAEVLGGISVVASVDPETTRLTQLTVSCPDVQRAFEVDAAVQASELTLASIFGAGEPGGVILDDLRSVSPELGEIAARVGLGPAVAVPVFKDNEAISVLSVVRKAGEPTFGENDLWFMTEVASHASAALTNASLYRRQSRIAETLQRSLIPDNPVVEHLEIASCYFAADGDVEVGGDFFDVVRFGPTKIGVVVGDVAGKGVTAAVHTAEAKYMLRAFAHASPEPGAVMTALNKAMCAYADEYTFVTIFYGLIDLVARTLTYINAGQEVPLILRANESVIWELRPTSSVAGVLKHLEYAPEITRFGPDDFLICYTDGVTDARANGERFGYERLYRAASSAPTTSVEAVRDHILAAVRGFGGGRRPDDQVVVVTRPRG